MAWFSHLLADIPGVRHAFLDVHESAVFDKSPLVDIKQVHGKDILHFTHQLEQRPWVDGVVTSLAGHPIGVVTADCLPLLMASRNGQHIASVHAGWRGTAAGIIEQSVEQFARLGVTANDIVVAIGPHIRACCYEVSAEFYDALLQTPAKNVIQSHRQSLFTSTPQKPNASSAAARELNSLWFDLPAFSLLQLARAGVPSENIEVMERCTYCTPESLGSYRRRTHVPATKTQQIAWIVKEEQ
ncbi:peptidoglycan editing factor PgeF [Kluyvera genomosp. 1]|uniref:peptidoglycan editing factor PgeF n=1 Tax=Kluyvera genomosp. 1 TaxID=2774053 RepID=UPI00068F502D|nr:peptidoglycan editing factor PgeF [Kluyvera genomosp. 1]